MKNPTPEHFRQAFGQASSKIRWASAIVSFAILLTTAQAADATTVSWVSGGINNPKFPTGAGYADGVTDNGAQYHTPCGIAFDNSGNYLFVADRDNNAIRYLDLGADQTWTFGIVATNLINQPIGVAVDSSLNVFVLNRGKGTNGTVVEFNNFAEPLATNATALTNAGGIALDGAGNIYVTASNIVYRISGTTKTIITTITNAGASLQGIVVKKAGATAGLLAVCDAGRNGIYLINPATGIVTTNAGFHGVGDFTTNGNNVASSASAKFNQPMNVTEAGDGTLIVSDYGNNRIKVVLASGVVTNLYGITSQYWSGTYKGFSGGTSGTDSGLAETPQVPDSKVPNASARLPFGVSFSPDGTIYTTEDYYHIIPQVTGSGLQAPPPSPPAPPTGLIATTNFGQVTLTWTAVFGTTNYNVKRSPSSGGPYTIIATTTGTTYTDTNVINGTTYYYVVSAVNTGGEGANSLEVTATPPIPPPATPIIGWFDYEGNNQTGFFTVLHPVSGANTYTANNDLLIAINPTASGLATYYLTTNGPQPVLAVPNSTNGSTPPFYRDGLAFAQSLSVTIVPDLVIKAVNVGSGGSSAVTTAEFLFQAGNPIITGNNAAQFTVSDVTSNVVFWYTTDGTTPTNASPSIGPIAFTNGNPVTLSINATTNTIFQIRAFRNGYQPSGVTPEIFSPTNFVPNSISFGFASGEASSDFVGAPGQTFYAPVTLTMLPGTMIYSLQLNITVTNVGPDAITPGAFDFESMLEQPGKATNTSETVYYKILPWMYASYATNLTSTQLVTNSAGQVFIDLDAPDNSVNLLGVGWVEHFGNTNLYNTLSQDLIQYSQAHDDLFPNPQQPNGVIVGGYGFQIPTNAQPGEQYQIQIGRPSATSDGVGAPGSSVYINAPVNGSLTNGAINSIKLVTAGQRKYLVGNAYPFRWFNAGDFGNNNLQNADVEQVFESAAYGWNTPPTNTDFYDCMDSSGCYGAYDSTDGYYTNAGPLHLSDQLALFDITDSAAFIQALNTNMFGDTYLDVSDVYVTYIRSIDSDQRINWIQRFWTNGIRVATITSNFFNPSVVVKSPSVVSKVQTATSLTNWPKVNFTAGDIQGSAGQTVTIPITATMFGSYPLRMLMLNLNVIPLDGSPALTTQVSFAPSSAFSIPNSYDYISDARGNGNFSAALWPVTPISQTPGLTGSVVIGFLTVTLPPTANANSAYDVHFDHASASPNGLASFAKQTLTGLVTLSSRTNSSYGDGIPDSWRLRWFGTTNNSLTVSNADACGDGINNWSKYIAGTDPTDPKAYPHLNTATVPSGATAAIHWPTVSGKQYIILRSSSLFSGSWSAIATNTGTGTDLEFDDSTSGKTQFYRVQILP